MESITDMKAFRRKIFFKALVRFFSGFLFIIALVFIPAGTLRFMNGWLFTAGLMIPIIFALVYLINKDPELLEKRINLKEKEKEQKKYVKLSLVILVFTFIIPGLDFRFGWSYIPIWFVITALILMIAGYIMFFVVMLQNRYASRVIEIQDEHKLIDTGLYSVVRHPMYTAATLLYFSSTVVLGSWYALLPIALLPFLLAYRIINEEKILIKGLPGYESYRQRVRYRLIPFVW